MMLQLSKPFCHAHTSKLSRHHSRSGHHKRRVRFYCLYQLYYCAIAMSGHVAISAATTRAKTPQVVSGEAYRRAILRKRLLAVGLSTAKIEQAN
jgi:hypothetical protein